jgi:rRNA processing protein Krr1/Pno1
MITIPIENPNKVKKSIKRIESKIKVKITFSGKEATITGEEFDVLLANQIVKALDLTFDVEDALLLINSDFSLQVLNIKDFTKKKDLKTVRSRLIGRKGRGKGTIADLTGAVIVVKDNRVGIIVDSKH